MAARGRIPACGAWEPAANGRGGRGARGELTHYLDRRGEPAEAGDGAEPERRGAASGARSARRRRKRRRGLVRNGRGEMANAVEVVSRRGEHGRAVRGGGEPAAWRRASARRDVARRFDLANREANGVET